MPTISLLLDLLGPGISPMQAGVSCCAIYCYIWLLTLLGTIVAPLGPPDGSQTQRGEIIGSAVEKLIRDPSAAVPPSLSDLTFEQYANKTAVLRAALSDADTEGHMVIERPLNVPTEEEVIGRILFGGGSRTGNASGCVCGTCPTARPSSRGTNGGGRQGPEQPEAGDDGQEGFPDYISQMMADLGRLSRERPRRG
jgi:hypothetical protein